MKARRITVVQLVSYTTAVYPDSNKGVRTPLLYPVFVLTASFDLIAASDIASIVLGRAYPNVQSGVVRMADSQ